MKAVIKYGRDSTPLYLIISSLNLKELELREKGVDKNAFNKVFNVRGRSKSRGGNESNGGSVLAQIQRKSLGLGPEVRILKYIGSVLIVGKLSTIRNIVLSLRRINLSITTLS